MNIKMILHSVKKLALRSGEIGVVFDLLERNIHRIKFVVDGVGTKDCLFIVEEQKGKWGVLLNTDMDTNLNNLDDLYLLSDEKECVDLPVIVSNLETFFLCNNGVLNVEVSFYGCRLSEDEKLLLDVGLQLGKIESVGFIRRLIKFQETPKWYIKAVNQAEKNCKFRDEEILYAKQIEELRLDIISKINSALANNDKKLFRKHSNEYNLLIWGGEKIPKV